MSTIDEYVKRVLDEAPPLTQETAEQVAAVLMTTRSSPAARIRHKQ